LSSIVEDNERENPN